MSADLPVSRNQLDKAGSRVRRAAEAGQPVPDGVLETIDAFRRWHVETFRMVPAFLGQVFHEGADVDPSVAPITSRLKTPEAIVAKLARMPTSLARMQDIAGARMVVPGLRAQEATMTIMKRLFDDSIVDVKDQREEADELGYRAIHIVIRLDGRLAEIQVRTVRQDQWAQIVEGLDADVAKEALQSNPNLTTIEEVRRLIDLKHGLGPPAALRWLKALSDELRKADLGEPYEIPPAPTAQPPDQGE